MPLYVHVKLNDNLSEKVRSEAERTGLPFTNLVKIALSHYLDENRKILTKGEGSRE